MDLLFFGLLVVIMIYTFVKNIQLFKRFKHNKEYIECYKGLLNGEENISERISNFINNEQTAEFKQKGHILKLNDNLNNDVDYKEELDNLDIKPLYMVKGKFNNNQLSLNSDSFVWLLLDVVKANAKNKKDVINTIKDKLEENKELENRLEYRAIIATINLFDKTEDTFFNDLLEGNYLDYAYDKSMIGIYKEFAMGALAYKKETLDEYCEEALKEFAGSLIGKYYLKDLDLLDKYAVKEEVKEEETIEEKTE